MNIKLIKGFTLIELMIVVVIIVVILIQKESILVQQILDDYKLKFTNEIVM